MVIDDYYTPNEDEHKIISKQEFINTYIKKAYLSVNTICGKCGELLIYAYNNNIHLPSSKHKSFIEMINKHLEKTHHYTIEG